jgi:autotransporter-associated beta strand protein
MGGGVLRFTTANTILSSTRNITLLANSFGAFDTNGLNAQVGGNVTGSGDLVKMGTGLLILTGTGSTFTGRTVIYAGSLEGDIQNFKTSSTILNYGGIGVTSTTAGLTFIQQTPGAYSYNGNITGIGSLVITSNGGTSPATNTVTLGGVNSYSGGTTVTSANTTLIGNVQSLIGLIGLSTSTTVLDMEQATNATTYLTLSGSGQFIKGGAGLVTMANPSTYSGGTTINGTGSNVGGLSISAGNQLGTGAIALNNATLQATGPQFATAANTVDLGTRAVTIGAGGATLDVGTFTDGYDVDTAPNVLKIGGVISGGVITDNLTKTSSGILVLSGANTYADNTVINGGTLQLGADNVIPDGASAGNVTIASGATFDLNGHTDTVNGISGAGNIDDTAPATNAQLTFGGTNTSGTLSGTIQNTGGGSLSLIKTGTGTEILSGNNTYSGKTTIQNGALSVASINSVTGGTASSGLGAPTTVANGTIDMGGTGTTGTLIVTGAGGSTDRVINFAGTNGGATIENDGTAPLTFTSNTTATGSGTNTFTLQGTNTGANTFQGNIVDPSGGATSVVKNQAGNWAVSGNNNYSGTTTVNGGNFQVGVNNVGSTGTGLFTANNSGTVVSGSGTIQSAATFNSGTQLAPGDNFGAGNAKLTVNGNLTMNTGSTSNFTITQGTLVDSGLTNAYNTSLATYQSYLNSHTASYNSAPVPAGAHDSVNILGNLTLLPNGLNNGSTFALVGAAWGLSTPGGTVVDLLDWTGSITSTGFNTGGDVNGFRTGGAVGDLTLPTLQAGFQYDVSHFLTDGLIVVVPEPSRALLLMMGMAMLFLRRRRRAE